MAQTVCNHPEGRMSGIRLLNDKHNCAYVDARNALIPEAERIAKASASKEVPGSEETAEWKAVFTREFHWEMDHLARKRGLIR